MQSASAAFLAEAEKTVEGARPAVEIEIETEAGWVSYGNRVVSVSDVDRVLEKYGEQGIGFAGDVTFSLENTDGIFAPGNRASGPFAGQLIGRQVAIYQLFYTKEPDIIPFMTTAKGMTTTVYIDEGCTEKLPVFAGKVSRCIVNDDRTVTLTVRDVIQDLVEAKMVSSGQVIGNIADSLKYVLEAAGFDVNTAAYETLRLHTAGTLVARTWATDDKAIDIVQDLNKACGTNVVANADGEMVMLQLFPLWGEFARLYYLDRSQEPLYSGDEVDVGTDLNVMSANGTDDEVFIVNQVTFTYMDLYTLQETTVAFVDAASILKYGIRNLDLATGAYLPPALAYVWPSRILDRFSGEEATTYDLRTSLRHSAVAEVGDHVVLTEPAGAEVAMLALVNRASRNPFEMSAAMGFEMLRGFQDEKWAFAGDASPGGSERDSAVMDYIFNKSFEIPWDAPSNMLPWKWSIFSGSGGTLEVSSDEQITGQYSAKCIGSGTTQEWSAPLNVEMPSATNHILKINAKGNGTGTLKFRIVDNLGAELAALTVTGYGPLTAWTPFAANFATGAGSTSATLRIQMTGFTGTMYFDDIQIDAGGTLKDFQENWLVYAYAGNEATDASPGFDSDGNANGVIDRGLYGGIEQEYTAF